MTKKRDGSHAWEVYVSNIGRVYEGSNGFTARRDYGAYVQASRAPHGRASGESVTIMCDGEPWREFIGATPDGEA